MKTDEDCIAFATGSAATAFDQASAHDTLADAIASYRQNVIDTLADHGQHNEYLIADALAAFDHAVTVALAELEAAEPAHYSVRVLMPLQARQRKHSVYIYRTVATSADEAVAAVRSHLADDCQHLTGWQIVGCARHSRLSAVMLDTITTCTQAKAAQYLAEAQS
jgi:class 3 adenylate cyclase